MNLRQAFGLSLTLLVVPVGATAKAATPAHSAKPQTARPQPTQRAQNQKSAIGRGTSRSQAAANAQTNRGRRVVSTARGVDRTLLDRAPADRASSNVTSAKRAKADRSAAELNKAELDSAVPAHAVASGPEIRLTSAIARPQPVQAQAAVDRIVTPVRPVGARQLGNAAWYGGALLGMRTASGARLDDVHLTAAHRTLPLNSLARVTDLNSGRSIVVTVTDRGPQARGFIIDLSPGAAEELGMKQAGVAHVAVEPVVAASIVAASVAAPVVAVSAVSRVGGGPLGLQTATYH